MAAPANLPTAKNVIPSYLYTQYQDDEALQAFVDAYNGLAQQYVDWFNKTPLPVYTDPAISGSLLDWVGLGLYGVVRPVLPVARSVFRGPFNTYAYNTQPFGSSAGSGSGFYTADDDIYKRVLTWRFYKGDGFQFNVDWLKRRVLRFLTGPNGTAPQIDSTYPVSVTFSGVNTVNIGVRPGERYVTGGALPEIMQVGAVAPGELQTTFVPYDLSAFSDLQGGISSGILPLPFQFTYVVSE